MRQIGTITSEEEARRFGAFLLTLGIANSVEEFGSGWAVWVESDDQLDRAGVELDKFRAAPASPMYQDAVQAARSVEAKQRKLEEKRRRNFIDVRTGLGQPRQWNAPLTMILIAISLVAGVLTHVWEDRRAGREPAVVDMLRIAPIANQDLPTEGLAAVKHGEVWRLVTPIFLHFGIMHIVFNMIWLLDLGAMIETRRGTLTLAFLVFVSAILSNLTQYYWNGPNFGGMSGIVYALFGYVWIKGRFDPGSGITIPRQTATIMLVWLFLCMTGILGPIANAAHLAGLIVGMIFAYGPVLRRRLRA